MSPTFFDFFKSFYYVNSYVPPVDLSDQGLSKHLMEKENPELAGIAQRLISDPEVQPALSEPITYDLTITAKRREILTKHGFKLLGKSKPIVEHPDLPGWIIKSGANPLPKDLFIRGPMNNKKETSFPRSEDSLLRIEMANRIAKIAKEENIDVVIPKKKLVAYANSNDITDPTRKYCVLAEKLNVLSEKDTLIAVQNMSAEKQRELAKKISLLIQKTGWVDPAPRNLRLTPKGELVILDTEPFSLMTAKRFSLFDSSPIPMASIEKCARVGLYTLLEAITQKDPNKSILACPSLPKLEEFHKQIKNDYEKISLPQFSYYKIAASVLSLGLIPLTQSVYAYSQSKFVQKTNEEVQKMKKAHSQKIKAYYDECERRLETLDFVKKHEKKLLTKLHPIAMSIEGVPF